MRGFPGGTSGKELACQCRRHKRYLGWEDPLEEGMATHSRILAQRIPWTEEPGGLESIEFQRVGHDWSDLACTPRAIVLRCVISDGCGPDLMLLSHAWLPKVSPTWPDCWRVKKNCASQIVTFSSMWWRKEELVFMSFNKCPSKLSAGTEHHRLGGL